MYGKARLLVLAIVVCATASPAWAQRPVPHKDSGVIGGDLGVLQPKQDGMSSGPALEGFYEYYYAAHDSVRIGLGWAQPKVERAPGLSMRHVRIALDLLHNWKAGSIQPFLGAGLGTYFLQARNHGESADETQTKLGGTLIGGLEFFASNTLSITGEARYHIVSKASSHWPRGGPNSYDPAGLALTIGTKAYF